MLGDDSESRVMSGTGHVPQTRDRIGRNHITSAIVSVPTRAIVATGWLSAALEMLRVGRRIRGQTDRLIDVFCGPSVCRTRSPERQFVVGALGERTNRTITVTRVDPRSETSDDDDDGLHVDGHLSLDRVRKVSAPLHAL